MKTIIKEMIGKTFIDIKQHSNNILKFHIDVDKPFIMFYHEQDCCEYVYLSDICGDLNDLLGSPITMAEYETKHEEDGWDSVTWTFYKFATIKGYVTITWRGESNGYYSEEVDYIIYPE